MGTAAVGFADQSPPSYYCMYTYIRWFVVFSPRKQNVSAEPSFGRQCWHRDCVRARATGGREEQRGDVGSRGSENSVRHTAAMLMFVSHPCMQAHAPTLPGNTTHESRGDLDGARQRSEGKGPPEFVPHRIHRCSSFATYGGRR